MKKILFTLFFIKASSLTIAQTITYGFKIGINSAKENISLTGTNSGTSSASAIEGMIGGFVSYNLGNLSIQPAILFTGKGGKFTNGTNQVTFNLYYTEMPLNFIYRVPVRAGNIYFGAAPYIALGTTGFVTTTESSSTTDADGGYVRVPAGYFGPVTSGYSSTTTTTRKAIQFGNDPNNDYAKLIDYGSNISAGIEFKGGFLLEVDYDIGLANTSPRIQNQMKNRILSLSMGYSW